MSTKAKAIFLTDASMQQVRDHEPLSARINQICERYGALLNTGREEFGAALRLADLRQLCQTWSPPVERHPLELQLAEVAVHAFAVSNECGLAVQGLSQAGGIALLEQLELYRMRTLAPPTTHS